MRRGHPPLHARWNGWERVSHAVLEKLEQRTPIDGTCPGVGRPDETGIPEPLYGRVHRARAEHQVSGEDVVAGAGTIHEVERQGDVLWAKSGVHLILFAVRELRTQIG